MPFPWFLSPIEPFDDPDDDEVDAFLNILSLLCSCTSWLWKDVGEDWSLYSEDDFVVVERARILLSVSHKWTWKYIWKSHDNEEKWYCIESIVIGN